MRQIYVTTKCKIGFHFPKAGEEAWHFGYIPRREVQEGVTGLPSAERQTLRNSVAWGPVL